MWIEDSSKSSILFKVWMKSLAKAMWKQYQFKEGWVWLFFAKIFHIFPFILMGFLKWFFLIFANTVLRIITKSHCTPLRIILHVFIRYLYWAAWIHMEITHSELIFIVFTVVQSWLETLESQEIWKRHQHGFYRIQSDIIQTKHRTLCTRKKVLYTEWTKYCNRTKQKP